VYTNVNLDLGADHSEFQNWNPVFDNISRHKLTEGIGSNRHSEAFLVIREGANLCAIKLQHGLGAR
jgi:hypothetical protein